LTCFHRFNKTAAQLKSSTLNPLILNYEKEIH
jgi:hypothetical protein